MDKDLFEKAAQLRHQLHMYPDLSGEERPTLERVMAFLKENTKNIEIHDKGHYVWACYRCPEPEKDNIAFRADCDALKAVDNIDKPWKSRKEGIGHKCGHDGHTASLAGLCLMVDRYGADRDVFFIFQPAEENGSGAKSCLDFIEDNDIKEIYAAHGHGKYYPDGVIASRVGTIQCASMGMITEMLGSQAHAATPEDGKNPALALCRLAEYSQTVLKEDCFKSFILATIIRLDVGKEAFGMSADRGRLLLTIRGEDQAELELLRSKLEEKGRCLAEEEGLAVSFSYLDEFPETRNHPENVEKVKKAVELCGYRYYDVPQPRRGSEDMGHFLHATKGAHYYCSFGPDYPAIHTETFDFDDRGIERIVNVNMALISL